MGEAGLELGVGLAQGVFRVHVQLARQHVDHALDQVGRFGHPERTPVGDAAGRLVGEDAVNGTIGGGDVVASGDDGKQTGRPLGRLGMGVEGAVIGKRVGTEPGDLAVLGRRQFAVHVIVPRERRRRQIVDAAFHPLDRLLEHDGADNGADIAGIGADLAAETAADVRRDDTDIVLRQA